MEDPHAARSGGDVTTIILAAGANTRLQGIIPGFMKPFILMNGKPLVHHAIDHAREWCTKDIIIVVSPNNAGGLTQIVDGATAWVLQPQPLGVVDAIFRAMPLVTTPWTLILCADNVFVHGDNGASVHELTRSPRRAIFGSRELSDEGAYRFTRYENTPDRGVRFIVSDNDPGEGCWIGPLLLDTRRLLAIPLTSRSHINIIDLINGCTDGGLNITPIPMLCSDCGVPEELT